MWKLGKKILSAALATALTATLAVGATAAAPVYSASISKDTLSLYANGKINSTYPLKDTKISLTTGADKDLLLCYNNKSGEFRAITLGAQAALTIGGTMDSLTVAKALDDKIAVTLDTTGNVTSFSIDSPNPVSVQGKVATLTVNAAAKVTIAKTAAVTKTGVSDKKAVVTVEKGATAGAPTALQPGATKPAASKPASSKPATNNSGALKLTVKAINADKGDRLEDLLEDLNDNVRATDPETRDDVWGTCKWASARGSELDSDGTFSFTFTPDDNMYEAVRGSVKIYVESGAGDISLKIGGPLTTGKGSNGKQLKLKDLTDALNKAVYATDENGNDVEGKAKWNSSNTDADSGRSYSFTFNPKSSRYNSQEGSMAIS